MHAYDGDWGDSTYWAMNHNFNEDSMGWANSFYDRNERNRKNYTNEFRARYKNTTVGFYYKNLTEKDVASGYLFGGAVTNAVSNYKHKVFATYGEYEYNFLNKFSFNISFREENSQYDFSGKSQGVNYYYEPIDLPDVSFKTNNIMNGNKISLNYYFNENTNIFVSKSKGFKAGGVNQQPSLISINRPFEPEYIYNTELGFKRSTLKTNTSLTLFNGNRKNQQVSISSQQEEGIQIHFYFIQIMQLLVKLKVLNLKTI